MSITGKLRQAARVMTDMRWWPFYIQRQFMGCYTRDRLGSWVASNMRPPAKPTKTPTSTETNHISNMSEIGLSHFKSLLSSEQASDIRNYFLTKSVHDPYRNDGISFLPNSSNRHPDSHIAHHSPQDIILAPHLLSIANRPDILSVVEQLLGCKPTIGYLAAWWSYPTQKGAQQAEHFHRDVDDWRFIKLFIYLTDVDANNGPHIYVHHSSASPLLREIRRFSDQEVQDAFGSESIRTVTGRAGDGFLEDTFGIHKGQPVQEGTRLIFQAVYSMYPLPYGPKKPVLPLSQVSFPDGSQPDAWINRLYLES